MDKIFSVKDLVALWPSRRDFALSVSRNHSEDVSIHQVHKWCEKGAIPAKYHRSIIDAAAGASLAVTAEKLVDLHSPRGEVA